MTAKLGVAILVCASLLASGALLKAAEIPHDDPLFIRLAAHTAPEAAAVLAGGDRRETAYEVYLVNFGSTPMQLTKVTITGRRDGVALFNQEVAGAALASAFQTASGKTKAENKKSTLEPGQSAALFLFPSFGGRLPSELDTAITVDGQGDHGGSGTVHIAKLPVNDRPPLSIASPLVGNNWLAVNGPSNTSVHRRAILLFGGRPKIGQRYAIDWVQIGPDGKTFKGDEHDNHSYYAYNAEIHAVADGSIVEIKDGIPENIPDSGKLAVPISLATLAGNHIIEALGDGRFAAYAHLRPGSLKVKVGDKVHAGQVIAYLGNTGNSSEPHLHFQICDAPSFPNSEGLPFAINQFSKVSYKIGKVKSGTPALIISGVQKVTNQEPVEDELDSFSGD